MKKIPTLFKRIYENHKVVGITPEITEGCEEAFLYGDATIKWDGSCTAIIDGEFYKRYDAKKGKKPPEGAIPCQDEPDPITGHFPHWVKVDPNNPADKWFMEAFNTWTSPKGMTVFVKGKMDLPNGTYEAIGKHFQGNPYKLDYDTLVPHGAAILNVGRNFEAVKMFLEAHEIEGIVFWYNGVPVCKIKRTDFGFAWPPIDTSIDT